jgi:hypothetical protein
MTYERYYIASTHSMVETGPRRTTYKIYKSAARSRKCDLLLHAVRRGEWRISTTHYGESQWATW